MRRTIGGRTRRAGRRTVMRSRATQSRRGKIDNGLLRLEQRRLTSERDKLKKLRLIEEGRSTRRRRRREQSELENLRINGLEVTHQETTAFEAGKICTSSSNIRLMGRAHGERGDKLVE